MLIVLSSIVGIVIFYMKAPESRQFEFSGIKSVTNNIYLRHVQPFVSGDGLASLSVAPVMSENNVDVSVKIAEDIPPVKNANIPKPKTENVNVTVTAVPLKCNNGLLVTNGKMNDNYCDCVDGSDEPLTSACSHLLVHSRVFHCTGGDNPSAGIYLSRVGDGVCDCMPDCSDETAVSLNRFSPKLTFVQRVTQRLRGH